MDRINNTRILFYKFRDRNDTLMEQVKTFKAQVQNKQQQIIDLTSQQGVMTEAAASSSQRIGFLQTQLDKRDKEIKRRKALGKFEGYTIALLAVVAGTLYLIR